MDQQLLEQLLANQREMQQQIAALAASGAPQGLPAHATSSGQVGAPGGLPPANGAQGLPSGPTDQHPVIGAYSRLPPGPLVDDEDEEMGSQVDNEHQTQWQQFFTPTHQEPSTLEGHTVCTLLAQPPPLQDLRNSQAKVVLYKGVPVTPAPTKQFNDKKQFDIQVKLEANMHLIIAALENDDKSKLVEAAAWSRSAWEDVLQSRRKQFAGRQSWKLDSRMDDDRAKLVTAEEEKKLRAGKGKGKGKGKGHSHWQPQPTPNHWRPTGQSFGKGHRPFHPRRGRSQSQGRKDNPK